MAEWRQAECRKCRKQVRMRLYGVVRRSYDGPWAGEYLCDGDHLTRIPLTKQDYERLEKLFDD